MDDELKLNYDDIVKNIRPFDLILFKGNEMISKIIIDLEKYRLGKQVGERSHVAMIVTADVIDHPNMKKDVIYIMESTMSGFLADGIKNVDGYSFFGSQVREFEPVAKAYVKAGGSIEFAKLQLNPIDYMDKENIKKKFKPIFHKYNNKQYNMDIVDLVASLFPEVRYTRNILCMPRRHFISRDWLFCSQMCFAIYQDLGLYEKKFNPLDVVPVDFLGYDEDGIPCLFDDPITILF